MKREPVSICIGTYNGEQFLGEQIDSIICELNIDDEIIISDDCSDDSTLEIARNYRDKRIKIYQNDSNKGHIQNFSTAMELSTNNIILLCDQDDIWLPARIDLMVRQLKKTNCLLVTTNFFITNQNNANLIGEPAKLLKKEDSNRYFSNIIGIFFSKRPYFGCAMALKKDILKVVLPIPNYVESHDLWIAMAANILQSNYHLNDKTLIHRLHNNNVTNSQRPFVSKVRSRFIFIISLFILYFRIFKTKM